MCQIIPSLTLCTAGTPPGTWPVLDLVSISPLASAGALIVLPRPSCVLTPKNKPVPYLNGRLPLVEPAAAAPTQGVT